MKVEQKVLLVSMSLLAMIGTFEGLRTEAYLDAVGVPTICYGSTKNVALGQKVDKAYCDSLLKNETGHFGRQVLALVKVPVNQNQYDALVSFAYNVGIGNFAKSTLLKKLNRGEYDAAAKEFDRWVFAKGRKLPGLVKRRAAERELFQKPIRTETA